MDQILYFFNTWSSAIQSIMIIVLVGITIWYAYSTKKMTGVMSKEYALNSMPYLSIDRDIDRTVKAKNPKNNMIQLKFKYFNLGRVPVKHYTKKVKLNKKTINPKKVESILFPGQKGILHSNFYKSTRNIGEGDSLEGEIEIVYWAVGIPERKFSFKRKFRLAAGTNTFVIKEIIKEIT